MRLLNAHTFEIRDHGAAVPPYAILSHTWGDDEVTYQDLVGKGLDGLGVRSTRKIRGCCDQAINDGLDYVWIDTCCIDKQSSAELSEAINSMFEWYRGSTICYAYLEDVRHDAAGPDPYPGSFTSSRWFTRGWTLQELIAPRSVVFYDQAWTRISTRLALHGVLSRITHIDRQMLHDGNLQRYSVAQKMSWASRRQTTRPEDQAYCLLGLFGVSMPLLYGEGRKAFSRLQKEIMRASDDNSIFAWCCGPGDSVGGGSEGGGGALLAASPAAFAHSSHIVVDRTCEEVVEGVPERPYFVTHKGIQISRPLIEMGPGRPGLPYVPGPGSGSGPCERFGEAGPGNSSGVRMTLSHSESTLMVLGCRYSSDASSRIALFLDWSQVDGIYRRSNHSLGLVTVPVDMMQAEAVRREIFVLAHGQVFENGLWAETETSSGPGQGGPTGVVQVRRWSPAGFMLTRTVPDSGWSSPAADAPMRFQLGGRQEQEILMGFESAAGDHFYVVLFRNNRLRWGAEWGFLVRTLLGRAGQLSDWREAARQSGALERDEVGPGPDLDLGRRFCKLPKQKVEVRARLVETNLALMLDFDTRECAEGADEAQRGPSSESVGDDQSPVAGKGADEEQSRVLTEGTAEAHSEEPESEEKKRPGLLFKPSDTRLPALDWTPELPRV